MRTEINIPDELGKEAIDAALEGLVELGVTDIERGAVAGQIPTLYTSGVVYGRENGTERWLTPSQTFRAGRGDCEDLAAWRASEMRVTGEDPDAHAIVRRSGPHMWHALVEHGDGTIEDPSRILGMGSDEVGTMDDWRVIIERERDGRWVASLSRGGQGISGHGTYAHHALGRLLSPSLGAGIMDLIPGGGIISSLLSQAMPPAPAGTPPLPGSIPGLFPPAEGGDLDASARRIAAQISRIATTEATRKLRDAQRRVSGAGAKGRGRPGAFIDRGPTLTR